MTIDVDRYPFSDRYLQIAGHRIYCVETGTGDPVLFLHGNPTSSYVWRDVMPAVAAATGRRCVAIDLPGLGKSDKPDALRYTLDLHRDIVAGAVDALGLERIVWWPRTGAGRSACITWFISRSSTRRRS